MKKPRIRGGGEAAGFFSSEDLPPAAEKPVVVFP